MPEDEQQIPQTKSAEPEPKETVPLSEGLRKGIDMIDSSTPPVDQVRPSLDAPQSSGQADGGQGASPEAASSDSE